MTRATRLLGAALLVAAVVPATPATAAPPLERLGLLLRRTTSGPSSFTLDVTVRSDPRGGFVGGVGARFVRGKPVNAVPLAAGSSRRWDYSTLQAGDARWSTCDAGVCDDERDLSVHGLGSTYRDDGVDEESATHFFVVAYGADVEYEFAGRGWAVVADRARIAYRFVDGAERSVASSHAGMRGVEVSGEYTAPGGQHGSLALAIPPCSMTKTGVVSRGVGTVTLDGGTQPRTFTCPVDRAFLADHATRATSWRLHGRVVGETTLQETRLFVVDVPARLP